MLLLQIPHLPTLCLPPQTPLACIPPLCYLAHMAPSGNAALLAALCIQKSNLNSSSSIRISGFSTLQSDHIHSRSGILSSDITHASGSVVIVFIRQGLSFSKLSPSFLSSLDPYSDYVEVSISLNNSSSLSFLNVYATPICSSPTIAEPTPFLPPFFPSPEISSFWGTSTAITPLGLKRYL